MVRTLTLLLTALVLSGCVSQPDIYAPPAQRKPLEPERLPRMIPMVVMSDPSCEQFFVQDILTGEQSAPWRWTRKRPTVKVALKSVSNMRFYAEFALPEVTFKETGPVSITFFVNGHAIDTVRYESPGQQTFEKPLGAGLLKEMSDNTLAADIDKVYISKDDKQPLGFILSRIGLVQ